jgi:hypothetical protein
LLLFCLPLSLPFFCRVLLLLVPLVLAGERWSTDHYLTSWPRRLFPTQFSELLHPFFNSLLDLDPDARLAAVAAHFDNLVEAVAGPSGRGGTGQLQRCEVRSAQTWMS